jgi:anti-sigma factor RsiW
MTTLVPDDCRSARRALLARADGELPAAEAAALARHLDACAACRSRARSLDDTLRSLRELPAALPFPDDALDGVWERTVGRVQRGGAPVVRLADRSAGGAGRPARWTGWRPALAAAALLAAVLGPWLAFRARDAAHPATPAAPAATLAWTPEERRAAAELKLVLALTDRALQRSQRAAVDGVLRRGVDPALRRVPLLRELAPDRLSPAGAAEETVR